MATPERPDPAWVGTLKEGDAVAVAERGRVIYGSTVMRITPGGLIKVGIYGNPLRYATAFCGPRKHSTHRRRPGYVIGTGPYSIRYLVPPEADHG